MDGKGQLAMAGREFVVGAPMVRRHLMVGFQRRSFTWNPAAFDNCGALNGRGIVQMKFV
jgi:hypothetical protein